MDGEELTHLIMFGSAGDAKLLSKQDSQIALGQVNVAWVLPYIAGQGRLGMVAWLLAQGVGVDVADDSGRTALTLAAHGGHTRVMRLLLRQGADPNHRDDDTETVLMWASDHPGNAAAVGLLLQSGAEVNARSDLDGSALSWAMRHDDLKMIRLLLYAGADVNAPGVLVRAVYNGFTEVVKLLLGRGADPDVRSVQGETPAVIARQ